MNDETMWCFAHSRESDTYDERKFTCMWEGYRGDCDVRLAIITPSDEWGSCPCGCGGLVTSEYKDEV